MQLIAVARWSRPSGIATRLAGLLVLPLGAAAQQLPFAVPIVTWDSAALAVQQHAYAVTTHAREQLYCIDQWRRADGKNGVILYVVLRARWDAAGEANSIHDVRSLCRAADGHAMPTLHTHSDGNCQFSPGDLETFATRGAPFDGVQCGERYFIWQSGWQINAIANELDRERVERAGGRRP